MSVMNTIKNLLRLARITAVGADDKDFPDQQVGYMGKVGDAVMWFPYGYHANIPVDELAIILSLGANNESRIGLPSSPRARVKPIVAGEVVMFHPLTGTKIHFRANGDIDVETEADVNVVAENVNVTASGDVSVDSEGTVTIDGATKVEILSADIINVTAGGNLTAIASGNIKTYSDSTQFLNSAGSDDLHQVIIDLCGSLASVLGASAAIWNALKARVEALRN